MNAGWLAGWRLRYCRMGGGGHGGGNCVCLKKIIMMKMMMPSSSSIDVFGICSAVWQKYAKDLLVCINFLVLLPLLLVSVFFHFWTTTTRSILFSFWLTRVYLALIDIFIYWRLFSAVFLGLFAFNLLTRSYGATIFISLIFF